jgi:mRNA interferase RelE/StbE
VPSYRVVFAASAERELKKLPSDIISRILNRIQNLASNPRPADCKKLQGGDREWRIRVGDYRVIYTIDDRKFLVEVTRIRHRSDVYQR